MQFFDTMRDTILMGVHTQNYKNGAFKSQIGKNTLVPDALDHLINSELTTLAEKQVFRANRDIFTVTREKFLDPQQPGMKDIFPLLGPLSELGDIFKKDAVAREAAAYLAVRENENNAVTFTREDDETFVDGIPDNAPAETFARLKAAITQTMGEIRREGETKIYTQATEADSGGFGKAFSKNLKNAFI